MKYFLKKKWTVEIANKIGYNRWKNKNPEYKDVTYQMYKRYWTLINKGIADAMFDNPYGFDLPMFLGNLSLRKSDREFKCEKDLPHTPLYNKELDVMELKPFPNIENKIVYISWKKNKKSRLIPDMFAVEIKSGFTKLTHKNIKEKGMSRFQMESTTYVEPSKCEDNPLKHPFDLV